MASPIDNRNPVSLDGIDYKFLAENCVDMLCHVDADRVIRYISPSSLDILGWTPQEMIGREFIQFVFSDDVAALDELAEASVQEARLRSQSRIRLIRKDQNIVWISTNARIVWGTETDRPNDYVLVMRDVTERKLLEDKLSALAMTDALTGLWNRRAFDQALMREWRRAIREESSLSLLLLDLDHFKPLNDRFGHRLGDECLSTVAAAISDTVRASDLVCRWGGDEMAVILPCTDGAGALIAAEKIRLCIEMLRFHTNEKVDEKASVTASIGVATATPRPDGMDLTPKDLLSSADRGLYIAKHDGQNRVVVARSNARRMVSTKFAKEVETKHPKLGVGGDEKESPGNIDSL